MLTGISTKEEVVSFYKKYLEKEINIIDEDDELYFDLMLAAGDDIIGEDVDYWSNQSVKVLFQQCRTKLLGE